MYALLLAFRYLRTRLIPLVAIGAVGLCVALVVVVVSIMSGFLHQMERAGKTLIGDVVVTNGLRGLPNPEGFIAELKQNEAIAAATPVVDTFATIRMPYDEVRGVQVWGIDPESFDEVTGFAQTLHWTPEGSGTDWSEQDFRRDLSPELLIGLEEEGRALARVEADGTVRPGICLGLEISIGNKRNDEGTYDPINRWFMPIQEPVVLTTIPPDTLNTTPEPVSIAFAPVNEFSCGLILIDKERVFVPLAEARRMTNMTTAEEVDEEGLPTGKVFPARSSKILVRGNGLPEAQVREIVDAAYREWAEREGHVINPMIFRVQTWRENQASFLQPVENERELMRTLFSLVYLVCAGLVLAIFHAIVTEKTRDIGVLRALGATRPGIAMIFVQYGVVIGILGAILGVLLGWAVVHNIALINQAIGDPPMAAVFVLAAVGLTGLWRFASGFHSGLLAPRVLGTGLMLVGFGLGAAIWYIKANGLSRVIWDPAVYYFAEPPNRMDWWTALTTAIGAVVFSVVGAVFPAARAADVDPVEALRHD